MDSSGNIYAGTASGAQVFVPAVPELPGVVAQAGVVTPFSKEERAWDLNLPEELPMAQPASMAQQRPPSRETEVPPKTTGIPMAPNYVYKITKEGLARKIFRKPDRRLSSAFPWIHRITFMWLPGIDQVYIKFAKMRLQAAW